MTEQYVPPPAKDIIDSGNVLITVPNPTGLIDFVNSTDDDITLFDIATSDSLGRLGSVRAVITYDLQGARKLYAELSVQPGHRLDDMSCMRELYYVKQRLTESIYREGQLAMVHEGSNQILRIFLSSEQRATIHAHRALETPSIVTLKASIGLENTTGFPIEYDALHRALALTGTVSAQVVAPPHSVQYVEEPVEIVLPDYLDPEHTEDELAIMLFFDEQRLLFEQLASPDLPVFMINNEGELLAKLAKKYCDVPLASIQEVFSAIVTSRREHSQKYGIPAIITIDDIQMILAAASKR